MKIINNKISIYALAALLVASMFLLLSVSCAPSKKARQKVTFKKCLQCHPEYKDRFTTGVVHSPVQKEACYSCHRPHGIYGKIVFRDQQPGLCYACHAEVKPSELARSIHQPLKNKTCSICHNPHNSPYAGLLLAEGDESCFTCHEPEGFKRKFVHSPVQEGCNSCHKPHASENVRLLALPPDENCRSCHDVKQQNFQQVHFDYPVQTGCILCHSPHSGSTADLLKVNVHKPVLEGQCSACHLAGQSMVNSLKDKPDTLCLQCHEINTATLSVHSPYKQGQCTSCHDPHASNYQVLLTLPPDRACLSCHGRDGLVKDEEAVGPHPSEAADSMKSSKESKSTGNEKKKARPFSRHKPVTEGRCLDCHKGHGSDYKSTLKSDPRKMCFNCHEQNNYVAARGSHPADDAQACETCHTPHVSPVRALLRSGSERGLCASCHRSTVIERGKFSLHKPFARGQCGECHQLHRPQAKGYLVKEYDDGTLCLTCHNPGMEVGGQFVSHEPVVKGQCRLCHAPHAADFDKVLKQAEDTLCYSCHQQVRKDVARFSVKHQPLMNGKCTSCHTAHGSPYANILKKNQPTLCLVCHVEVAEFWLDGYPHSPSVEDCLQCHDAHGANISGLLVEASGKLCAQCHETATQPFLKAHKQVPPRPDSCIKCHSPHGSPVKSMLYPVMHKPFAEGSCVPCHTGGQK